MYEVAKIQKYKVDEAGTTIILFLPNANLFEFFKTRFCKMCGLWLEDGRHITAEQRKKIYATIRDISEWTGYLPEEQKEWLKYLHIDRIGCQYFSLSDCSMDTAREYINTMLEYALVNGIQLSDFLTSRTDDIGKALYYCIKHKKCAVCGNGGEIHHVDSIGMGNDRRKVDDSGKRKICLCRKHHVEAHAIGMPGFEKRYKVYGIIVTE